MLFGEFIQVPGAVIITFAQIVIRRSGDDERIENDALLFAALLYLFCQLRQALGKPGFSSLM